MATFQSSRVQNKTKPHAGAGSQEIVVFASYTFASAPAVNDVVEMVSVPAGATITGITLGSTDMDTNVTPTLVLDVGDGDDTDRFIDGATIGQAGGASSAFAVAGFGYTYTANDTIDVLIQAGPATGAVGTLTMRVAYVLNR